MLRDPLIVPKLYAPIGVQDAALLGAMHSFGVATGSNQMILHTLDIAPSSSKRKGTFDSDTKVTMTTSHSSSQENKPLVTDRTLIRFDYQKFDLTTSRIVTMSVYVVIALPQGGAFTPEDARNALGSLALFTFIGGKLNEGSGDNFDLSDGETLLRLLDGEA